MTLTAPVLEMHSSAGVRSRKQQSNKTPDIADKQLVRCLLGYPVTFTASVFPLGGQKRKRNHSFIVMPAFCFDADAVVQEATKVQIDQMNGNCAVCWSPMVPAGEMPLLSTASSSSSCEEDKEEEVENRPSAGAQSDQMPQPQVPPFSFPFPPPPNPPAYCECICH